MNFITPAILKTIEQSINLALLQDPHSQEQLTLLNGQQILIEFNDLALLLLIKIVGQQLYLSAPNDLSSCNLTLSDTHVKGASSDYKKLLKKDGFLDAQLHIQGNAQTLTTLHKVMLNFELNWEAMLADKIGDIGTSFIAPILRKKWYWWQRTLSNTKLSLIEYLQEERQLLPTKPELSDLKHDLETTLLHLDKLTTRLNQLKKAPSKKRPPNG